MTGGGGVPERIVLRPVASPLPLGFLALAAATLLLSGLQLGWLRPTLGVDVALIIAAFVVPLQLITSVFGFLARDIAVGTGMGLLSGTWLAIALVTHSADRPGATNDALGLFLLMAAVAMLVPATGAATGKLVPAAVLFTTALRFAATGIYQLTASSTWESVAGIIGLVLAGLAVYAAAALMLEATLRRPVLPVGRVGGSDGPDDERPAVEREGGVTGSL